MRLLRLRQLRNEVLAVSQAMPLLPPVQLGDHLYSDVVRGNFLAHVRVPASTPHAEPQLLVDPNLEHGGSPVVGVGPMSISHDGRKLAFLLDRTGNEAYEVVARWIDSSAPIVLPRLDGAAKAVEWDATGRFLYVSLTSRDDPMRPCRVVAIDTDTQQWHSVAEERDPAFMLELGATKDRRFIRIGRLAYDSSEQWIVPAVGVEPVVMQPRQEGILYTVEHLRGDEWIVFSGNALFKTDSFRGKWNLLHRDTELAVAEVDCFATRCLLFGYRKSVPCISSVDLSGSKQETASAEIPSMTIVAPRPNLDMNATEADVMMASPLQLPVFATLDSSMQLHCMPEKSSPIETLFTPESGLPITVVRGSAKQPCLLQVYGAYGAISPPEYEPLLVPLLARGWTLAFAHVAGDGMLGPQYSRDKKQSIADLNECARRVSGLCSGVVLRAASAGAFTAAAALLSGRQQYRGALMEVPFLNAFDELSAKSKSALTQFELREWGDLDTLKQCDPTVQLREGRGATLPPLLLTCSESDPRVSANAVAQFARLARARGGGRVQVLETVGGHGGDGGLVSSAKHAADLLLFLLSL
jgi:oligopeptidase B